MSAELLLVEDDPGLGRFLLRGLQAEGHACSLVGRLDAARAVLATGQPDALILDRMLPDGDGLSFCRELRACGDPRPILLLTALDDVGERVDGLRGGADDYLCKPFDFEELIARLDALLRRACVLPAAGDEIIDCGRVTLQPATMEVYVEGQKQRLSRREFLLLQLLATSRPRILSRERILARVWGQTTDPQTNIVDVYIARLRRKLDKPGETSCIETLRGVGYRMP